MGRFGSDKSGARASYGFGHGLNRRVLSDDALMQMLFQMQQFVRLALEHARDRDAGHLGDDLGDVMLLDDRMDARFLLPRVARPVVSRRATPVPRRAVSPPARIRGHPPPHVRRRQDVARPRFLLLDLFRHRRQRDAHFRRRLVDQVDRLVGQESLGDM